MAIDPRILKPTPKHIDITEERDVSEEVMEHAEEHTVDESTIPSDDEMPVNGIIFHSMDGKRYLINRDSINWMDAAASVQTIESNLLVVRQVLQQLIASAVEPNSEPDTSFALSVIKDIVEGFCKPTYTELYSGLDTADNDYHLAVLYCTDAIELMNIMLKEIAVFNVSKSFSDLFNIYSQEEIPNDDHIQEDQ